MKATNKKSTYIKKKPELKECEICEKPFSTAHKKKKTCSEECGDALRNKRWRERAVNKGMRKPAKVEEKRSIPKKYLVRGLISSHQITTVMGEA